MNTIFPDLAQVQSGSTPVDSKLFTQYVHPHEVPKQFTPSSKTFAKEPLP